jgi:hypothetical protein
MQMRGNCKKRGVVPLFFYLCLFLDKRLSNKFRTLINMKSSFIISVVLVLISVVPFFGQSGIVVTGQSLEVSSGKISASVGQIDFQSAVVGSGSIQEGIQQSSAIAVEVIELNALDIKVYPNPTEDVLYVDINSEPKLTHLILLSTDGKSILLDMHLNEHHNSLSLKSIASGVYVMQIIQGASTKQTFKIIKQ